MCDGYLHSTFRFGVFVSDIVIMSDMQRVLTLHFAKAVFFFKEGVFSTLSFFPGKEAEIFLVEILDQENIIVKESCGMGRWNWRLAKLTGGGGVVFSFP